MNELSRNDNLSIEEIIMHLSTDMNIPNHILNQISNEQLQNIKVREAIVNCVENSAFIDILMHVINISMGNMEVKM